MHGRRDVRPVELNDRQQASGISSACWRVQLRITRPIHGDIVELRKSFADAPSCLGRGIDGEPKALEYSNISRLLYRVER